MKSLLGATWLRLCNMMKFSPPAKASLREKAITVARRVTAGKDTGRSNFSCPVCFSVLQTQGDADLIMMLAVHMSLWHPDDVILQWEIMQKKKPSTVHLPSLIIGVGVAAGFGALLAISAKNRSQQLPAKPRR